jgi:hypothetical protein
MLWSAEAPSHPFDHPSSDLRQEIQNMPPLAILAVFSHSDVSSDEIEQIKRGEEFDPAKLAKISNNFSLMLDGLKRLNSTPDAELIIAYGLAQTCPNPKASQNMMDTIVLMQKYRMLIRASKD